MLPGSEPMPSASPTDEWHALKDSVKRFEEAWQGRGDFAHSYQAWANLADTTFAGLVDRRPSDSFFPDLYARFTERDAWRIFEDVIPTLEELASRGVPLAAVSNWDERLRPLLKALNLEGYFEAVLVSSELYFAKPSNVIFEHPHIYRWSH